MKETLLEMRKRHRQEEDDLRSTCKHPKSAIKISKDHSVVGHGCAYPSVHVVCRHCGSMKIIFRHTAASMKIKIKKTLEAQGGFEGDNPGGNSSEERLGCQVHYDWELE